MTCFCQWNVGKSDTCHFHAGALRARTWFAMSLFSLPWDQQKLSSPRSGDHTEWRHGQPKNGGWVRPEPSSSGCFVTAASPNLTWLTQGRRALYFLFAEKKAGVQGWGHFQSQIQDLNPAPAHCWRLISFLFHLLRPKFKHTFRGYHGIDIKRKTLESENKKDRDP